MNNWEDKQLRDDFCQIKPELDKWGVYLDNLLNKYVSGKYSDIKEVYDKNFSNVINNPKLEFCPYNYSQLDLYKLPELKVSSDEIITIVCFDIFKMFLAFKIRKQLKEINLDLDKN